MATRYLGLMSGTSMDGLDIVMAAFEPHPQLLAHHHYAMPAELAAQLNSLTQPQPHELDLFAQLDRQFAIWCAACVNDFLEQEQLSPQAIRAIGSHGQTIRHAAQIENAYTIQLGDPNTLAVLTQIDVIADFRRKDIALGGQGAPLVPAFHQAIFASASEPRAILNLGGIANITWLPGNATEVLGFDTGPANTLLDFWWQAQHPEAAVNYDHNGQFAAQGHVQPELLEQLLADPYFSQKPPKSTGRDYFHLAWLRSRAPDLDRYAPADIQRTLVELTAISVVNAMQQWLPNIPKRIFIAGGGAFNPLLRQALADQLPTTEWTSTAELGVHPQQVEALAFAWLAQAYINQLPGNLPAVTGARRSAVLGGLFKAT